MRVAPFLEPLPQPGQLVRWRHPLRAFALGWFNAFGPGPFEFVGVVDDNDRDDTLAFLVKTESGEKEINALWVGQVLKPAKG